MGTTALEPEQTMALRSFAFNRLNAIAAVLDESGAIVDTNEAWRLFADLNDGSDRTTGQGVNYLEACDRAATAGVAGASTVSAGLRQILAGEREHFDFEYPCPSPTEDRWFMLQASSAPVGDGAGVVLFHVDFTAQKLREDRFVAEAEIDPLTALPNRRAAVRLIAEQLALASTTAAPLVVYFLDLDRFKAVNDNYGHHIGDELLVKVALRARRAVRDQDQLCRLGGDEFVLVCPGLGHDGAARLSARLRDVMSQPFQFGADEVTIGVSVGFVESGPGSTVDQLLGGADAEMYLDKQSRRRATDAQLSV